MKDLEKYFIMCTSTVPFHVHVQCSTHTCTCRCIVWYMVTMVANGRVDASVGQFLSETRDQKVRYLILGRPCLIPRIVRRIIT